MSLPKEKGQSLAKSIEVALIKCKPCSECFLLSDISPCIICSDNNRNNELLCVVESSRDVFAIENTKEYNGYYFVLGNLLSPINGIGPNEIRINEMMKYLEKKTFMEIILAISPSTEGETTMQYLADNLGNFLPNSTQSLKHNVLHGSEEVEQKQIIQSIRITRLATGIPYGSDMEYTASNTLLNAFKRRFQV